MTYAPIPNEDVDVGSPLSTALMTQLRDNTEYARFGYSSVSGATQALDLEAGQFFDAGTITADTTVSFSNVPTEARWTYTAGIEQTNGWDISEAVLLRTSNNLDLMDEQSGIFFKPDGLTLYIADKNDRNINQYSLETAWDVSSLTYKQRVSVNDQSVYPRSVFFKPDGTKMYVTTDFSDEVNEYNLSTAWDVSTASYSKFFSVAAQDATVFGLFFKPDGSKMYVTGLINDNVYEYNLSTAWDVSTASYSKFFSFSAQSANPVSIYFKPDGLSMFVLSNAADDVKEYSMSTAWDVSTASYVQNFVPGISTPTGMTFKPGGDIMYVGSVIVGNDSIRAYSIGTQPSLTLPTSVQNPPAEFFSAGERISYDFITADGGTTVKLIGEEVL